MNLNIMPSVASSSPSAIASILKAAEQFQIQPKQIVLEILESEFIGSLKDLSAALRDYRSTGLLFAIDDFGAGYAGLNLLAEFQPDFLKKESQYFDYDGRKIPIEYYDYIVREENLKKYATLVAESKKAVSIPVIASINCFLQSVEWISYAQQLEAAGADALELNMFFPPTDFKKTRVDRKSIYFKATEAVTQKLSIPTALKISYCFSDPGPMIQKLSQTGIAGLVLFNRYFSPDIDIDNFTITNG